MAGATRWFMHSEFPALPVSRIMVSLVVAENIHKRCFQMILMFDEKVCMCNGSLGL